MSFSLSDCKWYTRSSIGPLMSCYEVTVFRSILEAKVNEICLKIGFEENSYDKALSATAEIIEEVAKTEEDRENIKKYIKAITNLGMNYRLHLENLR